MNFLGLDLSLTSTGFYLIHDGGKDEYFEICTKPDDFADDIEASAIVIMTRQENKLQKFFVGSMATELIKKANVPIVCISPKELNNK